jgi:DNA primase
MVNVQTVLNNLHLNYEDKGNRFLMCCPYHHENTPSFSIYRESGHFKCFGCGKTGNIYDLIEHITGKPTGSRPSYKEKFIVDNSRHENNKIINMEYEIEGELLSVYSNEQVLSYCWSIGLTNNFIDFFNVKYSKKIKFHSKYIIETELDKKKYFYNRIVIPCKYNNQIVNYECRDFTKKSATKVVYPKGAFVDFFFNGDNVDWSKEVFIVEGIKGLSHVWSLYSKNVVSTFGKILKDNQKRILTNVDFICRIPDNDSNKIDFITKKPVDNIALCIKEMDEFYPKEFNIAKIQKSGFDPANLDRQTLKETLDNRKKSSEFILDEFDFFSIKKDSIKDFKKMI